MKYLLNFSIFYIFLHLLLWKNKFCAIIIKLRLDSGSSNYGREEQQCPARGLGLSSTHLAKSRDHQGGAQECFGGSTEIFLRKTG
jgi:hypothetical protein